MKRTIGNLYNVDSYKGLDEKKSFKDAGLIIPEALVAINPQIYVKQLPSTPFFNTGVVVDNTGGWTDTIRSLRLINHGGFSNAGDASDAKGIIDLSAEVSSLNVMNMACHAKWQYTEVQQYKLMGDDLPQRILTSVNTAYIRSVERDAFVGVDGKKGGNTLLGTAKNGFGTTANPSPVDTKAVDASTLYSTLISLLSLQSAESGNTPGYVANYLFLSPAIYAAATGAVIGTGTAGTYVAQTVMAALKMAYPDVTIVSSQFLTKADSNKKDMALALAINPQTIALRIPVPLTIGEVVNLNAFDYQLDALYRFAGVDVLEPTAGYVMSAMTK